MARASGSRRRAAAIADTKSQTATVAMAVNEITMQDLAKVAKSE